MRAIMSRVVFARFSPVMAMMLPLAGAFTTPAAAAVARSSSSLSSRSLCMQSSTAAPKGKLLVLGGTGFVGARVTELALERGYEVVSISRRGAPAEGLPVTATTKGVSWRSGDAAKPEDVEKIMAEGGFTGVIHAIGMLFEGDINKWASGSRSVPRQGATYDEITRQTAFNAAAAAAAAAKDGPLPFGFVSAAEAGWTFDAALKGSPVEWMHRYLIAKRAVESKLIDEYAADGKLRPVIVRPSLIFTYDKPAKLLPVAAFALGNAIGLPFVDRPVTLDTVAKSLLVGVETPGETGIFGFKEMDHLAARF